MDFIVIVEPFWQQGHDGFGICQDSVSGIVAFERFDEGLRDAVALRRSDRSKGKPQAQRHCGCRRLPRDIGAAVVGQPFDRMRCPCATESVLDGLDHQITHHLARNAAMGDGRPGDDLAVAGIDDEENADDIAVAAFEFEMVRAPADVGA